ncbi:unnamed protein product [Lampetra planeri]
MRRLRDAGDAATEHCGRFPHAQEVGGEGWPKRPVQLTALGRRIVAAAAGLSAVIGTVEGVNVRILIDTGASRTIISDMVFESLPPKSRAILPVAIPCFTVNGQSLGIVGHMGFTAASYPALLHSFPTPASRHVTASPPSFAAPHPAPTPPKPLRVT